MKNLFSKKLSVILLFIIIIGYCIADFYVERDSKWILRIVYFLLLSLNVILNWPRAKENFKKSKTFLIFFAGICILLVIVSEVFINFSTRLP